MKKIKGISLVITSMLLVIIGISLSIGVWLYTQRYTRASSPIQAQLNVISNRYINGNEVYSLSLLIQTKVNQKLLLKKIIIFITNKDGTITPLVFIPYNSEWLPLSVVDVIKGISSSTSNTNSNNSSNSSRGVYIDSPYQNITIKNDTPVSLSLYTPNSYTISLNSYIITITAIANAVPITIYPQPPIYITPYNHIEMVINMANISAIGAYVQLYMQNPNGQIYTAISNSVSLG